MDNRAVFIAFISFFIIILLVYTITHVSLKMDNLEPEEKCCSCSVQL